MNYQAILFMKVGGHGGECLDAIIERKLQEEREAGATWWGYGGTLCHPTKAVQPFVRDCQMNAVEVRVMFSVTESVFAGDQQSASHYSQDCIDWVPLPDGIDVRASRYGLIIRGLQKCEEELELHRYEVPTGPSEGRRLSQYIRGRVDKGLGRMCEQDDSHTRMVVPITYNAELVPPYAVFLSTKLSTDSFRSPLALSQNA